jgi:hypothetical protein
VRRIPAFRWQKLRVDSEWQDQRSLVALGGQDSLARPQDDNSVTQVMGRLDPGPKLARLKTLGNHQKVRPFVAYSAPYFESRNDLTPERLCPVRFHPETTQA